MFTNVKLISSITFIVVFLATLLFSTHIFAKTIYMGQNEANQNLSQAFAAMDPGDELIIRDGTYTGGSNVIGPSNHPPVGLSNSAPTIIRAEHDGAVYFDGQNIREMFEFNGRSGGYSYLKYWKFLGIQWIDSSGYGVNINNDTNGFSTSDLSIDGSFIYFKSCGFYGRLNSMRLGYIKQVLFEDCWSWGKGRYGYQFYLCDNIIVRRNVDRRDDLDSRGGTSSHPAASYINYASHYVEFQNCISLDINSDWWEMDGGRTFHDPSGNFFVRSSYNGRHSTDTHLKGCIALNTKTSHPSDGNAYYSGFLTARDVQNTTMTNCIVWGSTKGFINTGGAVDDIDIDHCTAGNLGDTAGSGFGSSGTRHYCYGERPSNSGYFNITNSIAYNSTHNSSTFYGLYNVSDQSDFNSIFGNDNNTSTGANDDHSDPLIDYILRIETNSPNYTTGSPGHKGATVLFKYGVDGTFYGDSGYKDLTNNELWPWPNEEIIKAAFRKDHGTTDETRGFCANGIQLNGVDPITLTSYIWEYLGNPIPPEIYGNSGLPGCTITGPTSGGAHDNGDQSSISLSGTATDDVAITRVTWENQTTGATGDAVGTGSWTAAGIPLAEGDNLIVVTASDADSHAGEDRITVTYTPDGSADTGNGDGSVSSGDDSGDDSKGGCFVQASGGEL